MNSKKKEIQNKEKSKENVANNPEIKSRIVQSRLISTTKVVVQQRINKLLLNLRKLNKPKRQKSFQTTQEKMDFMISAYNNQLEMQNGLNYSSDDSLSEGHLFKTFSLK